MTPAVARERARCLRIAKASEDAYAHLADRAKAAGDDEHRRQCLVRVWCAQEIAHSIRNGYNPPRSHTPGETRGER